MNHRTSSYKQAIYHTSIFLLVLLWSYTAISKWAAPNAFMSAIARQPLGPIPDRLIFWTVPATEILAALALCTGKTKRLGLALSTLLMSAFTIYVGLALMGTLGKIPCACGGVIGKLGWKAHLWFNLFFLATAIYATVYHIRTKTNGPPSLGSGDGQVGLPT